MTRAVIFDMGGVILDLDHERCVNAFKAIGMDSVEEMLDNYHQKGFFRQLETGEISEEEFYRQCIGLSAPGTTAEDVRQAFLSFVSDVQPYKLELIRELSEKYDIYVLSNNNPIVVRDFDRMCGPYGVTFSSTFKKCYFSYELKIVKPDPEFFRYVLRDIGIPGEDMLFIDDSQTNVEIASKEGMRSIWYDVNTNLRDCVTAAL